MIPSNFVCEEHIQTKFLALTLVRPLPPSPKEKHHNPQKSRTCVRRFKTLPRVDPPYSVVGVREPAIDPGIIILSKPVDRLMIQFASLSLSDRCSAPSTRLTHLERLPPEIALTVAESLAFFDKKALAATSQRMYHLLGPIQPPDRFAWRVQLVTSFNRVAHHYFDMSLFSPDEIRHELMRIWRQIPAKPRSTHFTLDPCKSRLKDFNCLYFPAGFGVEFGLCRILCQTLGQYIAIQFNLYIRRLIEEAEMGERLARKRSRLRHGVDFTQQHLADLHREIKQWQEMNQGRRSRGAIGYDDAYPKATAYPRSAVEGSMEIMVRMGYELLRNRVCMYGRICEIGPDEGTKVQRPTTTPRLGGWLALDEGNEGTKDWNEGAEDDWQSNAPFPRYVRGIS